ncbi:MAG: hypothetical protein RL177_570 [Bacteroidota bacterium]|jgi:hypothetical protein
MNSIRKAFHLAKIAWLVILADKELLLYPILSGLAILSLLSVSFFPMLLAEGFGNEGVSLLLLFMLYLAVTFIVQFFNAALVSSALVRLNGGNPTLKTGFRQAWKRVGLIAKWSLIAATVGMLLNALRKRSGMFGSLFGGILEIGWNLISFFVIPVLIVEGISPMDALHRSKDMLKKTWGEQLSGSFGFGVLTFVLALPVGILIILLMPLFGSSMIPFVILVVYLFALVLFMTTMSGIYQAALYLYAREGKITGYFEEADIRDAFAPAQNR